MGSGDRISISVGNLTDMCRTGDINFRFSSRSSAQEGIAGHQRVQKSRDRDYVAEHPVSHLIRSGDIEITVNGRVDGYGNRDGLPHYLDEIKTIRVNPEEIPETVLESYWLQASLYGFLLSREFDLNQLLIRLCLYHLDEKREYIQERHLDASQLGQIFIDASLVLIRGIERQREWETVRQASLDTLAFPYQQYRQGQRDMAVSVFRAAQESSQIVMQAPTGIGKTMGTIFPAVHALGSDTARRVFYLSAKTSTQELAETSAADLETAGARLRSVTLTAKDKICFSPGEPCDPDHCIYARGYYDRINLALDSMLDHRDRFNREAIEAGARKFELCPFELGLDLSRHCDLIISDYNYVFDPVVYLRRFFDQPKVDSIGLVDEAHNLVDRGRDMFSATIDKDSYLALARHSKGKSASVHRAAQSVNRAFLAYRKAHQEELDEDGHATEREVPLKMLQVLQNFCGTAEEVLRQEGREPWREELLDAYFSSLRFVRTAENYADDYVTLMLSGRKRQMLMRLYCVDPSSRLKSGFERLSAAICFSATMQPQDYFQRMLGTEEDCNWYRLPSPFPSENLTVNIAGFVDTTYNARRDSMAVIVQLIRSIVDARSGNYIVFFPSYEYLDLIYTNFVESHPEVDVVRQSRHMSDEERQSFLERFNDFPVCGFAVMGGVFSEGIDLTGSRLIGAIVVGVGLPQIGIERDLIRDHFPDSGFEYAYQYPGLVRVLQTAGRVIRSETDRGIVCLVDRRYQQRRYRELLPEEWQIETTNSLDELAQNLAEFWRDIPLGTSD